MPKKSIILASGFEEMLLAVLLVGMLKWEMLL